MATLRIPLTPTEVHTLKGSVCRSNEEKDKTKKEAVNFDGLLGKDYEESSQKHD